MGKVAIRIDDRQIADRLWGLAEASGFDGRVVITDRPRVKASDAAVVLITTDLVTIMKCMDSTKILGVLHPDDVSTEQVASIARGTRVFSVFTADDFGLRDPYYRVVQRAARGLAIEEVAEKSGYSARHVRRILGELGDQAGINGSFSWPLLAPLFPQ